MPSIAKPLFNQSTLWTVAIGLYLTCCAVLDIFPRYSRPDLRYTGSDPAVSVWNLGWPLAEFIYDPRFGPQVGPTAWMFIPFQCVFFACGVAAVLAIQRAVHRRRRGIHGVPAVA